MQQILLKHAAVRLNPKNKFFKHLVPADQVFFPFDYILFGGVTNAILVP